ncbi:MAG: TolB family protein [Actinomycetota bacterium]
MLVLLVVVVPGMGNATHERLTRASVDADGGYAGWGSEHASMSGNGRRIVFEAYGSLVPEDRNYDYHDIYLRDFDTQQTTLLSVAPDGGPAYGPNDSPVISGNGRYVAFTSGSERLIAGDTNGVSDIYVRDLETQTTQRASVANDGSEANGESIAAAISDDGRYIAFVSSASNLVSGDANNAPDVFVRDTLDGATTLASVATGGAQADAGADQVAISGDGRTIAFTSIATNLAPDDTATCGFGAQNCPDVFVRDLDAGTTRRISTTKTGAAANGISLDASLSADGSKVAFVSRASDLPGGAPPAWNVYVADTATGAISLASPAGDGRPDGASSRVARIAADGHAVIFESYAGTFDHPTGGIYIRDLLNQTTEKPAFTNNDTQGNARARDPALSSDGRVILFRSDASDFGPNNGEMQTYVYDRTPSPTEMIVNPAYVNIAVPRVSLVARLIESGTDDGIGNRTIRFLTPGGIEICRATTSRYGYAACAGLTPEFVVGAVMYRAVFGGDSQFLGSSADSSGLTISRPPCSHTQLDEVLANLGIPCN